MFLLMLAQMKNIIIINYIEILIILTFIVTRHNNKVIKLMAGLFSEQS